MSAVTFQKSEIVALCIMFLLVISEKERGWNMLSPFKPEVEHTMMNLTGSPDIIFIWF